MQREPIQERAQGRWRGILAGIGVESSFLSGKHGPCPICGGKDRFRFDDKDGRGTWICSQCPSSNSFAAAGDGVEFVKRFLHVEFKEAAERIEALIGAAPKQDVKPVRSDADKLADAWRMWRQAQRVTKGDPVYQWLFGRVGSIDVPPSLRFVETLRYPGDTWTYHPGMVAIIQAPDGSFANVHRTFLTPDGLKAPVEECRMIMPGVIPKGSAVRLAAAAEFMGIGTGIETSLGASLLFGVPVWAALTDALLAEFEPPEICKELLIFGDNDAKFGGQAAAYVLARRQSAKGARRLRVEIPLMTGNDWNDEWNAKRREGRAA